MLWLLSHPSRGLAGRTKKAQGAKSLRESFSQKPSPEGTAESCPGRQKKESPISGEMGRLFTDVDWG
jgi:hypothetical protein